jgi:hypothetical protein
MRIIVLQLLQRLSCKFEKIEFSSIKLKQIREGLSGVNLKAVLVNFSIEHMVGVPILLFCIAAVNGRAKGSMYG